jgi:hypothetical protein
MNKVTILLIYMYIYIYIYIFIYIYVRIMQIYKINGVVYNKKPITKNQNKEKKLWILFRWWMIIYQII